MFYVTGQTFISSLADYKKYTVKTTSLASTSTAPLHTNERNNQVDATVLINGQQKLERALTWFPAILILACLLPLLAYLYILLALPEIMKSTNLAFDNDPNNNSYNNSNNNSNGGANNLPLILACPTLRPRQPAKSVDDLRADDIKVVIGVGDSVMAGFGAKGVQNEKYISLDTIREARGISFAMGGDHGAITIPNLINFYSHNLYGASVGDQIITICFGDGFCPIGQYRPSIDVLNAAQSGARSLNIDHELDYILKQLDKAYQDDRIKRTDWKLLTFFIGSNDLCHSCAVKSSLPGPFSIDVQLAIERIRLTIPYVLVQIIGLIRIDEIYTATEAYPSYCRPFQQSDFVLHDHECMCAHTAANRTFMAQLMPQFNTALQKVATQYQGPMYTNNTFTVIYHPLPADINSFPIQAISDVDCFHPSELAHAWFSKELWKMMHTPSSQTPQILTFSSDEPIYCIKDEDRLQVH
ncbi:hypothetical protein BJ944DRAFT_271274 [Cunninghamella echinulata]|nr:hypothetical protein BJ944DRAFT_271274 [Cunninghamella echinulata]